ncbi:hypothetical protein [Sebaldella sp. S0638]|uniref:hypothetical protein n=1 Tax=Sebaldella sp. S0638 TaxID=2957809 RepID=UPI0020A0183E|nr:hypothetical protein [Sebaldella sp. S0638]MCP1224899.1 hypothetical protein [Sebaldella sp. S0638]
MKKVLVALFLLLGVITYTKPYYSNGKEENIQTVYNVVGLSRPKMQSPVAQAVMDDFTRVTYDAQVDSMLTSKEDFAKLNKYYDKRVNAILDKFIKNKDSFSDSDMDQIMGGLTYLKGKLQEYTSAWVKK